MCCRRRRSRVEVARRLVPAGRADQSRRQGRRGRAQPRPHRLQHHRAARLRRRLHLGRLGGRPRRQGRPGGRQLHHRQARRLRSTASSSSPTVRSSASRCRSSSSSTRRSATRRRRREGAEGHHRSARRGQLGVAARRGRRFAGALAHQGVLPGGHQGARRREALRRDVRRRRIRRAGHLRWTSRSAAARSSRPTPRRTASR